MTYLHGPLRAQALAALFVFFSTMVGVGPVRGQNGPPIVRSISVEYSGPATVSKERILAQIRTRVGQPYSSAVVEQDIRNLYSTGAILNVRIFGEPEADGVKVIVAGQTRSIVREIEIEGAERISAKKIR